MKIRQSGDSLNSFETSRLFFFYLFLFSICYSIFFGLSLLILKVWSFEILENRSGSKVSVSRILVDGPQQNGMSYNHNKFNANHNFALLDYWFGMHDSFNRKRKPIRKLSKSHSTGACNEPISSSKRRLTTSEKRH